jgi:hypothetical protein
MTYQAIPLKKSTNHPSTNELNMINEKLKSLYDSHKSGLAKLVSQIEDLDGPLLMKCWEEEYLRSKHKILFLGQESNGWLGYATDDVDACMNRYEGFQLSKNGTRTVFWQYVYWVNALLNPQQKEGNNFLWSNVSKFSTLNGKQLDWGLYKDIVTDFNCLSAEIQIVEPDVFLSFSGPTYDEKLKLQFEDNLAFEQVFEDIPSRQLARLIHPSLPKHSYRTYHPIALQRQGKSGHIERLVDFINNAAV